MRGLCGLFSGAPLREGEALLRRVAASSRTRCHGLQVHAQAHAAVAAFGEVAAPMLVEEGGFLLVAKGHPRIRGSETSRNDPLVLLRMLREGGATALERVEGDFAIVAWDERRRRGFIAVDRIGIHRIVYMGSRETLRFATTLDLLCALPGVDRTLSPQAIFDYVFQHVIPGPQTIFAGLSCVPAGHVVEFGDSGATPSRAYWSMRFDEQDRRSFEDLKAEFVESIRAAVAEAASGQRVGAFLSGGTDSSTVSGMLARVGESTAQTFSIGFDAAGYDEMEYARIAAKHYGCEHHEYYVTPKDVVDAVPLIAASYDQPFGNASAIPTYYCARLARQHGIDRLLAGDGGDELFGGNERYSKHYLLGLYQNVPAPLRRYLIEPALVTPRVLEQVPLLRKLRSYVLQARPPMPQRYASSSQLMHLGAGKVFTPEFLASVDPDHPGKLLEQAHAPHADASLINQMLGIDLRFILTDGDLPKVTHMCDLAGVDVAFPLLDDRLIEFSRHLPADLKLRGTALRWFFKKALSDFLPPAVITKQKHGFGLPVGTWLVGHQPLFDLAADSIQSLRHRGLLQPAFVDDLLNTRLREHAAYFGGMAWVLMMLGLWLESRQL